MKLFAALATLAVVAAPALPAAAQTTVYRNHPMVWHKPVHCKASIKISTDTQWKEGACTRVVTSTGGGSHNIRFVTGPVEAVYITSTQDPTEVHHVMLDTKDTSSTIPVTGKCEFTARNTVICSALANDRSFGMVNGAVFGHEFPELRAILR